jgi:hypothetical protein
MIQKALAVPFFAYPGFVLRLAYFAVAPFVLAVLALKLPVTGAIVNLVLFLAIFFVRGLLPGVGTQRLFRRMARLELYYEKHPPKPFLYYVFFPLFAPYWVFYPPARREIFHYRRLSGVGVFVFVGLKLLDYWRNWHPIIPFRAFAKVAAIGIVFELAVFAMIVMPLATTVVTYKRAGARRRLIVLFIAAAASLGFSMLGKSLVKRDEVRLDVAIRRGLRVEHRPEQADETMRRALVAAAATLEQPPEEIPVGGRTNRIRGRTRDVARGELGAFFRPDEIPGFSLFMTRTTDDRPALVLFAPSQSKRRAPVWRALVFAADGTTELVGDRARFSDGTLP